MGDSAERRMTVDEFLDWHDGTDTRHMLIDGIVVAMSPVGQRHSRIAGNEAYEIRRRLKPPCTALVEAGLALSADTCVEADVAATCEPDDGRRLMEEPFLVVEVLSPSTRRDDLSVKVVGYQEVPTIREIWAVDSERRWVRVWRRSGEEWVEPLPVRAGAFRSEALGGELTLDELYAGTSL
jgi:Uma2 family endonuclease